MTVFKSDFLRVMSERGFIHQCSDPDGLDKLFLSATVTAYQGFDCTAPSYHVGNLLGIMMLRWLQKTGHRPIALMGGGTTRVGDPSGKDGARKLLTEEEIEANKQSLKQTFAKFLEFGDRSHGAIMVDNADWLAPLNYIAFLRDVGRHFSVNRMLAMDSVKLRLDREHELTFLEFNYMVLQAYDFTELARRYDCFLQIGGSDQWGNIVNGIDLGRRLGLPQLYALTCRLLTTSSGAKMGKTARGAIWLNADMLSAYEYWQFWRNTEDADVGRFLKLYTDMPLDEIARLEALQGGEINDAKKVLANAATTLLHGRAAAAAAAAAARRAFEEGGASAEITTKEIDRGENDEWQVGRTAVAILKASELVRSSREARQKIDERAVKINDREVRDSEELFRWSDVDPTTGAFKVQLGKKKIVLVKPKA
ncbi:MAG: tyrosine--tRNA ligase [Bauldia sp.]